MVAHRFQDYNLEEVLLEVLKKKIKHRQNVTEPNPLMHNVPKRSGTL